MADYVTTIGEEKFKNQSWKKMLDEISNYAPNKYGRGKSNYSNDHPLAKHLKISGQDVALSMMFLEDQGLIEYDKSENNWIILTPKGFEVALQNQNAKKANRNFMASLFLSFVIAIMAIVNVLIGIDDTASRYAIAITIAIVFIIGGVQIKRLYGN